MITKDAIGKRVRIIETGDLAINIELRPFIYDEENKYYLVLERITKGGRAIVRHGKHTFSLALKAVQIV